MIAFRLAVAFATGFGVGRGDWWLVAFGTTSIVAGCVQWASSPTGQSL